MAPKATALQAVLRQAEAHADRQLVQDAARELLDLLEVAGLADSRRVATLVRGRRIARMRSQGIEPAAIRSRMKLTKWAYSRAVQAVRDSRNPSMVE